MAKSRKRSDHNPSASSGSTGAQSFEQRSESTNSPASASSAQDASFAQPAERKNPSSSASSTSARHDADDRRQRVEQRAYELYLSRGGAHGSDWEDWLAAERELVTNRSDEEPSKR